ncbi:MAG: tRNA lysidine(34) synthetase TilS [Candidatus Aminicenantes bacterium]
MFLSKIEKTIRRHQLLSPGDKVAAACSGGPDSVALLLALMDLSWKLELTVAHFNHQLRKSAGGDEKFVQSLARRFSLACECRREDIRLYAREHKMNLEEACRKRRYAFLEETARKSGAAKIAVGHTLNDQAETVLMHLFRGAGMRGLGGIQPRRGRIVRPLIGVSREEVLAYLDRKGMEYRVDETNIDPRFLRSRIRHRVMPLLKKEVYPRIEARLGRMAEIIQAEDDYMHKQAMDVFQSVESDFQGRPALRTSGLDGIPLALRRRVIREFYRRLRGGVRGLTFEDADILLQLGKDRMFPLEKGLVIKNIRGLLTLRPKPYSLSFDMKWEGTSPLRIPEAAMSLDLEKRKNPGPDKLEFDDRKHAWLDAAKIAFPLRVRNRRRGDRYRPLRAPGRKPLKEIFRSRNIAPELRDRYPVILSQDRIVWIPGFPVSHDFRVTKTTSRIIKIEANEEY